MSKQNYFIIRFIFLLTLLSFLASCAIFESADEYGKNSISSSLMDYLYPNKKSRKKYTPEIPVLKLPLRVGLAFVPSTGMQENISSDRQLKLLQRVKKSFISYPFIESIEIIPSSYLKGKGFDSLEQISRMYGVDVMALVSYDQVVNNTENSRSLLYWTIVGMYVIKGNSNAINTFVDTAVFDIASRKLLFRAPGISQFVKSSTLINLKKNSDDRSAKEFIIAVDKMTVNLDKELTDFRKRVKEEKIAKVQHKQGYGGGGSLTFVLLLLLFMVQQIRQKRVEIRLS